MKAKLLTLFAAVALAIGLAGGATTASADSSVAQATVAGAGVQLAYYGGGHGFHKRRLCRKWYYLGFVKGIRHFRYKYLRHCRRPGHIGHRRVCRKWYYLGFVKGIRYYRFLYLRKCRRFGWRS